MGDNSSSQYSMPLTAKQMAARYQTALDNINPTYTSYNAPTYQGLSGGDYDALEQSLYGSQATALDKAWANRSEQMNQSMADRGLWASGQVDKALNDTYSDEFLPQYQQAAQSAAAQRYQLQASDLASQNAFNQANAQQEYESGWRPLDYKAGLWNNTGGVISSGSSSGWSI